MFVEVQMDEPVIASPSIGVQHRFKARLVTKEGLLRGFCCIGNNFDVNLAVAFEQSEVDSLSTFLLPLQHLSP